MAKNTIWYFQIYTEQKYLKLCAHLLFAEQQKDMNLSWSSFFAKLKFQEKRKKFSGLFDVFSTSYFFARLCQCKYFYWEKIYFGLEQMLVCHEGKKIFSWGRRKTKKTYFWSAGSHSLWIREHNGQISSFWRINWESWFIFFYNSDIELCEDQTNLRMLLWLPRKLFITIETRVLRSSF